MITHNTVKYKNTNGHQRVTHINSIQTYDTDHNGQHTQVNRLSLKKTTEKPQDCTCHEEILSIQINDTQKLTYNAKVSNTEATVLFDSGTMLSCISK